MRCTSEPASGHPGRLACGHDLEGMTKRRRMQGRLAALVLATVASVLITASPAWAPACGPFSLDVKDAMRVWVGTIVRVDDAPSNFSAPDIGRPIYRLHVRVQEVGRCIVDP